MAEEAETKVIPYLCVCQLNVSLLMNVISNSSSSLTARAMSSHSLVRNAAMLQVQLLERVVRLQMTLENLNEADC